MNKKRNLWILIGLVILSAVVVSGFVLMQPSAEDILVQMLENDQTITDGHAVVAVDVDSIEQDASGTLEIWAARGEENEAEKHHGAFRVEVLEATDEKAQGAVIVSDGEMLWAYSPSENKVFVGTLEEAKTFMEENELMFAEFSQMVEGREGKHKEGSGEEANYEHPESAQEAVEKLQEYVNISKSGTETIAGETANLLKLEPIAEQMPSEYAAIGGLFNMWIGIDSHIPLAVSYTGGSIGEASIIILEFEVNAGVDETLFTFEIPPGAELVTFAELKPESLTLEEAGAAAQFELLVPTETPSEATLVDILEVQGTLVQRYTLLEEVHSLLPRASLAKVPPKCPRHPAKASPLKFVVQAVISSNPKQAIRYC